VFDGIANACLCAEMHDALRTMLGEDARHRVTIREVGADEAEIAVRRQLVEPRLLQADIVVVIQVVDAYDGVAALQQGQRRVIANEPCRPGNQYPHRALKIGLDLMTALPARPLKTRSDVRSAGTIGSSARLDEDGIYPFRGLPF